MKYLLRLPPFFLLLFFAFNTAFGQTTGLIYKPASGAGSLVLDPNQDGYSSKTTAGFGSNDQLNSEIPFVPMPIVGSGEPDGDLAQGPRCGFTDLVRSAENETMYTYSDGTNLYFRFRLGGTAENSKGYSIFIDTDQKFGSSGTGADPNYIAGNPGFEVEISLQTNFGVYIYNVDGVLNPSEIDVAGNVKRPYAINAQKSIAGSTICTTDYFYDFYVPYASLPFTSSTPLRMIGGTVISPNAAIGGKISDVAGIDDNLGITDDLWADLINVFPPTSGDDLSTGGTIDARAACPSISSIPVGTTAVSGTTTEVNGATIEVFRNGLSQGTTLATGGSWTLTGLTATVAGQVFTATAKVGEAAATATGTKKKSTSYSTCNSTTVAATCANAPISLTVTGNVSGVNFTLNDIPNTSYTVSLFDQSTGSLIAGSKWAANENPVTVTTDASGNFTGIVDSNQGAAISNGVYYLVAQGAGCASDKAYICQGATATATPTIPLTINPSATSILVSSIVTGTSLILYIDGDASSYTVTSTGTSATISGISGLVIGKSLTVLARENGKCPTFSAATLVTAASVQLAAPTVDGTYCGATTVFSGSVAAGSGTTIQLYKSGTSGSGYTTTGSPFVTTGANWTITVPSVAVGQYVVATAGKAGAITSVNSNEIQVLSQTSSAGLSITNPATPNEIRRGTASISGTGTPGDVIRLYIDGFIIDGFTATVNASNDWTISGLDAASAGYDVLYAEGVIGVTAKSGVLCESAIVTGGTILCQLPSNAITFSATSATTICAGETVSLSLSTTENLVIYSLKDQSGTGNGVGPSFIGNGSAKTITTYGIETTVTSITLVAQRIGITCEQTIGTIAVAPEQINLTSTLTQPNDCASPDGSITLSGLKASSGYTLNYKIDGIAVAQTTPTSNASGEILISGLSPGQYTDITVTGTAITLVCGNVIAGPLVLVNPSAPSIVLGTTTNPTTCSGTQGSIVLTGLIASTNYKINYVKDGLAVSIPVLASDGSGAVTIASLGAGVYSNINVTDAAGCKSNSVGPVTLSNPVVGIALAGSSNPATCGGAGSINLSFTNITNGTYTISYDGGSFPGIVVSANAATISATAGVYSNLKVTDITTGCITTNNPSVTISDPALNTIAASRVNSSTCAGNGVINLTFTNVPAGSYTINYVDAAAAAQSFINVTVTGDATSSTASISTPAGTYNNLSITVSSCVSTQFPDIVITDPTTPTIVLNASNNPTTCSGTEGSIVVSGLAASSNYTLNYTVGGTATSASLTSTSLGLLTLGSLPAGVYTNLSATNTTTACVSNVLAGPITLVDPTGPTITLGTLGNPTTCSGTNGSIILTGVTTGSFSVNFLKGGIVQTTQTISATASGITIAGLSAGAYTNLSITNTINCISNVIAGPVTLSDPAGPTITLGTLGNPTTCSGSEGSIPLTFTNLPDGTYTLNYVDGASAAQTFTNVSVSSNSASITGLSAGVYNDITITNSGCTSVENIDVTLVDPTAPTIVQGTLTNPTTCGGSEGQILLTGVTTGTFSVNFSKGGITQATQTISATASGIAITGLPSDTYTNLSITNINNCISNVIAGPVTLSDPTAPSAPSITVVAENCSAAASNTVTNYVSSGITYSSTPTGLSVGASGVITG
ncbi:MAG: hypothetical protein ACJASN_001292, partial [Cyclobacteriaceae bacterium]